MAWRPWVWLVLAAVAVARPAAASVAEQEQSAGERELKADRLEAALLHFDAAVAAEPARLPARFWRARCQIRLGHWAPAADDLTFVVQHKPESVQSWTELARCRLALGQTEAGEQALAKALTLDPKNQTALELRAQLAGSPPPQAPPAPHPPDGGQRPLFAPAPPLGPRVGFQPSGLRLDDESVEVTSQRLYDYTFGSAPTDWVPAGGTWEITNRYSCEPDWNFFGGWSRGLCALWNKRDFEGDQAVEAYVAFRHGLKWADAHWFYIPTDLNINLCSDFNDLSSGYSFIYSGRNGSTTMIRRGTQVLAETTEAKALVPQFTDSNPLFQQDDQGREFGTFHRHWWRLECRRAGSRLSFAVDGNLLLEATDPNPVRGGHVAFWTVGSGMMIARVRVAYAQEMRPGEPKVVVHQPAP
jgi:tetratricopeptide (TPR) repeat protein